MVEIHSDLNSLSTAAARTFANLASLANDARGRFNVVLSGGSTPRRTYELLAQPPFRDQIAWSNVHVFWSDERCVPLDDPRSNYRMACEALLDHVPIPSNQIHPIPFCDDAKQSAKTYESTLKAFFGADLPRFDLVFLGLGENGHTASLFPDTPVLTSKGSWVESVYVAEQDIFRVTMTAGLLNQAASVVFLVQGATKAVVLRDVIEGEQNPARLPAQLIRPENGDLRWFVDQAAAKLLSLI